MIAHSRLYTIDSHQRQSGTHSNFTYKLDMTQQDGFTHCCVLQASIPKSYLLISENKNTFILTEIGVPVTVTIPVGNYSATTFCKVVAALLNTASPNHWTYTLTMPNAASQASTGLITYTVTGNGGNQPSFTFNKLNLLHEQFGFTIGSTQTFFASSLISSSCVVFQSRDNLEIHSDISDNGTDDILQDIISSQAPDFSNIKYQCTAFEAYAKKMRNNGVGGNVYRFSITDEDGNALDFRGVNCVISIILFRKESPNDLLKQIASSLAASAKK